MADPAGLTASDGVDVAVSDTTAPSAQAWFESVQGSGSQSRRVVRVSCSDTCDGAPAATAQFDGQPVVDGDVVTLPVGRAADLVLSLSCQDASGNAATVQAATPSSDATRLRSESVKAGGLRKRGSFGTARSGVPWLGA